jgi:large subunit ribosomal protein L3
MRVAILGRKVGMTQMYDEAGNLIPVTVVDTKGCIVSQVKSKAKEGYNAVQLAYGDRKPQNVKKATAGHFKKANSPAKFKVQELRLTDADEMSGLTAGTEVSPSIFQKGDFVDVIGIMKGRGFAGVMKRHGFSGKNATHGTSKYFRHGGSNGSNTFPGKVWKNKGMPGQMGNCPRTVQNLRVVDVRPEESLLLIRGAVPGCKNGTVMVQAAMKRPVPKGRSYAAQAAPEDQPTA